MRRGLSWKPSLSKVGLLDTMRHQRLTRYKFKRRGKQWWTCMCTFTRMHGPQDERYPLQRLKEAKGCHYRIWSKNKKRFQIQMWAKSSKGKITTYYLIRQLSRSRDGFLRDYMMDTSIHVLVRLQCGIVFFPRCLLRMLHWLLPLVSLHVLKKRGGVMASWRRLMFGRQFQNIWRGWVTNFKTTINI